MKFFVTPGISCFPPPGFLAAPSAVWSDQGGMKGTMPAVGGRRSAAAFIGHSGDRTRILINSIFTDLPVIDRLRTSASEP